MSTWLRQEDARLTRGKGFFVSDLSVPGLLHLVFLRSPYPHARVASIDTDAACSHAGVVAVLTHRELAGLSYPSVNALVENLQRTTFTMLDGVARYVGDPVALVIANTIQSARDALDLIQIEFEPLPMLDLKNSATLMPHAPLSGASDFPSYCFEARSVQKAALSNDARQHGFEPSNTGLTQVSVDVSLTNPRLSAAPLEPRSAAVIWHSAQQSITAYLPTQTPARAKHDIAKVIGFELSQVRVIAPDVGGAFGARASIYVEDLLVIAAAKYLHRSLKWTGTRSEEFMSGMHGRGATLNARLVASQKGELLSFDADMHFALGAWMPFSGAAPGRNAAKVIPGPYRVGRSSAQSFGFFTHTAPVNIYRGAGRPEGCLIVEAAIEKLAHQIGIDPLELRRINVLGSEQMPYALNDHARIDSADFCALLDKTAALFGYQKARTKQQLRREAGQLVGIGIGLYVEPCGEGWESARITQYADGRIRLMTGCTAQGQGRETAYSQIVRECLGLAAQYPIEVIHGDTGLVPDGIGALASRGTSIGASAVVQVCQELKEKLAQGSPVPGQGVTCEVKYTAPFEAWGSGCVMVQVTIDRDTGELTIEQLAWVDDAGRVINPALAKGQLLGGLAQGLGQALLEHIVYDDDGQLITGSLMDYALPRASDMPPVKIETMQTPTTANLLGAKGVGEAGCIGVPAALLNAAMDALRPLGVETLDFPLSSHRLWSAMRNSTQQRML